MAVFAAVVMGMVVNLVVAVVVAMRASNNSVLNAELGAGGAWHFFYRANSKIQCRIMRSLSILLVECALNWVAR